jgi:regulator of sirC expression with transglutaminase-like and TPR domain
MSKAQPAEETVAEVAPSDYLRRLGQAGEGPHDVATAALMLAALDHPEKKLAPYHAHLAELTHAVRSEAGFARDSEAMARALSSVLVGRYGYDGDRLHYDDPTNADLMAVIERRRGMPVTLGILYIHAARGGGMEACGLLSPGHFLLRMMAKGREILIDPFNGGAALDRDRMRAPQFMGGAPLGDPAGLEEPNALEPVSDTDVLLRLQNNIKSRALKNRDSARGIEILRRMVLIAPRRPLLWLELGRIYESSGSLSAARRAYESCLSALQAGDGFYNEAALALQALKRRLN